MADTDKTTDGLFGPRLSQHLRMKGRCLVHVANETELVLAVTRLTCSRALRQRTPPIPSEAAFCVLSQLSDLERYSCWLAGRPRYSGALGTGNVTVIDLRDSPQWEFKGHFDALHYYIPVRALDAFALNHGAKPISTLECPSDQRDPFLATLSNLLLSAVERDPASNQLFLDHLGLSLLAHFAQTYGGLRAGGRYSRNGLAPWQERRAKEIMRSRLASHLTIADVAAECRLTAGHFSRAFRRSTGSAPHEFLSKLRIDEAKRLMLNTKLPLADIALICGFGDQSYFTRVFSRTVGASPGAWRRACSEA